MKSKSFQKKNDSNNSGRERIDPKSGLSDSEIAKINRIYQKQLEEKQKYNGAGWTFWDERVHMENLFCTRFNYLILSYSLFIAAFATLQDKTSKLVILGVGFVLLFLISIFLIRAWKKLDIILKIVFNLYPEEQDEMNWQQFIDKLVKEKYWFRLPKIKYNKIAGVWVPIILCISFLVAFFAIVFGWWDISTCTCS